MFMTAEALCDYLPHGTEVFDDDALDAAAVAARAAWLGALGFTPEEGAEMVRQTEARWAAERARKEATSDEEREEECMAKARATRQRLHVFLGAAGTAAS